MKKMLVSLCMFFALNSFSQETKPIAVYSGDKFTVNLNKEQQEDVFKKICEVREFPVDFDEAIIDDPEPLNMESTPYIFFEGSNKETQKWLSAYFQLTKEIKGEIVEYRITITEKTVAAASGSCTGVGCSKCHKERNWFLGPVVGCTCNGKETSTGYCNHTTGGGPSWWEVLGFLVGLL